MHAKVTRPTIPIGMSRSVIGSVSLLPALRAREAAIALARPLATGLTSFSNVQIADTPLAPAPTKRTLRLQVLCASAPAAVVTACARAEQCGRAQPQPITAPLSNAIPTDRPTKWPLASSQEEEQPR